MTRSGLCLFGVHCLVCLLECDNFAVHCLVCFLCRGLLQSCCCLWQLLMLCPINVFLCDSFASSLFGERYFAARQPGVHWFFVNLVSLCALAEFGR